MRRQEGESLGTAPADLGYRPHIDGLRAVAVAMVIGFHAFPETLPGGFAGVDVFFVISGYLITGILAAEIGRTGGVDIVVFYRRRLRRIVPALALVLAATLCFGWLVLLPSEYEALGLQTGAAAAFLANLAFWSGAGYFAPGAAHLPLLHLWSLAIEEQFYLVWPMALAALARLPRLVLPLVAAALALSFVACLTTDDPATLFYSPLPRAWELLAGALLALLPRLAIEGKAVIADIAALTGLWLIMGSALLVGPDARWPAPLTLAPIVGAMLLVGPAAGSRIATRLLANRPAVAIGLISYPLYLWHWPLLSYAHILHAGPPPLPVRLAAIALALLLAILTFRLVETPIRFGRLRRRAAPALALILLLLAGAGLATYGAGGLPSRGVVALNSLALSGSLGAGRQLTEPGCLVSEPPIVRPFSFCRRDAALTPRQIIWGDSKAEALYWSLVRQSHAHGHGAGWQLVGQLGGCQPMGLPGATHAPECDGGNAAVLAALEADRTFGTVVLAAGLRTLRYNGLDASFTGMEAAVARLLAAGHRVVFVVDNPTIATDGESPADCVRRTLVPALEQLVGRRDCDLPLETQHAATADYRARIAEMSARFPALEILDTEPLLCDAARDVCPAVRDGALLYSYGDHISDAAGALIARRLDAND